VAQKVLIPHQIFGRVKFRPLEASTADPMGITQDPRYMLFADVGTKTNLFIRKMERFFTIVFLFSFLAES